MIETTMYELLYDLHSFTRKDLKKGWKKNKSK